MSSRSSNETDDFQKRLDGLPPELQVMIYDFTFSAGPTIQPITKSYKSPTVLGVSRKTREQFATSYYNLTIFRSSSQKDLRRWLSSLPIHHHDHIENIHFDLTDQMASNAKTRKPPAKSEQPSKKSAGKGKQQHVKRSCDEHFKKIKHAEARLFFVRAYIMKRKVRLKKDALKVNVRYPGIEEEIWTHEPEAAYRKWRRPTTEKDPSALNGEGETSMPS